MERPRHQALWGHIWTAVRANHSLTAGLLVTTLPSLQCYSVYSLARMTAFVWGCYTVLSQSLTWRCLSVPILRGLPTGGKHSSFPLPPPPLPCQRFVHLRQSNKVLAPCYQMSNTNHYLSSGHRQNPANTGLAVLPSRFHCSKWRAPPTLHLHVMTTKTIPTSQTSHGNSCLGVTEHKN